MRALLTGRFDEAERHAHRGAELGQGMELTTAEGVYGIQMFSIRRQQGRLAELAPVVKHFVASHSTTSSWRPGLALIYSDLGYEAEAREEFERLAANDFSDIPHDALWQICLSFLSEVCAFLNDSKRADILYQLLLPYAKLAIVVGNAVACTGAASRNLGQLAAVQACWSEAEAHFKNALEFNCGLDATPWLARTKQQYAAMLQTRAEGEDLQQAEALLAEAGEVARDLGMEGLLRSISAQLKTD